MVKLCIFRRDLRMSDNTALNEAVTAAAKDNEMVLPIFIFTPEQVTVKNEYKTDVGISFMIRSLEELRNIQCFYGTNDEVLQHLFKKIDVTGVYWNKDHSHYAIKRDKRIIKLCKDNDITVFEHDDYNLQQLGSVKTGGGTFYSVYTPFYRKASAMKVRTPYTHQVGKHLYAERVPSRYAITLQSAHKRFVKQNKENVIVKGGRSEANRMLSKVSEQQKEYHETRNMAWLPTTQLSAHIKFGTVSIREAYFTFKKIPNKKASDALVGQLYWNDFYDQLMMSLPYDKTLGKSNYKGLEIKWETSSEHLKAWKEGNTGFPFIDAGMRQLNQTGWMHNRARMAVANFLAMTLLIDWREGEKYFATQLVDYDVSQNNGNWQWSSGVGVDKTGYLRMYNPFSQSKSHDPNCEYIKKYIPELSEISAADIHKWDTACKIHKGVYTEPIVSYSDRRDIAIRAYKRSE